MERKTMGSNGKITLPRDAEGREIPLDTWWCTRCGTWYEDPLVYIVDDSGLVKPHEMRYCPMCRAEVVRYGR